MQENITLRVTSSVVVSYSIYDIEERGEYVEVRDETFIFLPSINFFFVAEPSKNFKNKIELLTGVKRTMYT